jgi:rod shape-determining protein MreD
MKTSVQLRKLIVSLSVAYILSILPLPGLLWWWRPKWVPLVLIYWITMLPSRISFGTAFLVGIISDVLMDTLLGEHALANLFLVAVLRGIMHVFRTLSLIQQAGIILPLLLVYELIIICLQGMFGQLNGVGWFCLPVVVSALLWPWIYCVLHDYTRVLRKQT